VGLAVLALFPRVSLGEPASHPVVVGGSSGHLALIRRLAEAFQQVHPEIAMHVPGSLGSSGGIRAAADGAIDIGLTSRPLTDEEKGWGLTVSPYGRTAVVVGAHPTVADDEVTFADLIAIMRGTKSRWRDGREIIVISRNAGSSTLHIMGEMVPGFEAAFLESYRTKRWMTVLSDQDMNRLLAQTPYAIGFTNWGALTIERRRIKALRVNGVPPTPETVRSGRYPLVKPLALVFRDAQLSAGAKAFLAFARSREGIAIQRANGYVPSE